MESVKPPDAVNWAGNVDYEWRTYKQRFMLYLLAVGLEEKSDKRKIALLLTIAGQQAVEVYNTASDHRWTTSCGSIQHVCVHRRGGQRQV